MSLPKNLIRLLQIVLAFSLVAAAQDYAFNVIKAVNYEDVTELSTPANPAAGVQRWYANSSTHALACVNATGGACSLITVASGASALGTNAITAGKCAGVVTALATGTLTTDNVTADFNADPTSVPGYAPSVGGVLLIVKYPTVNNVNFKVCNNTAGNITPGAVTLNWRVIR